MCDRRQRDMKRVLTSLAAEHGASVKLGTTNGGHVRATFVVGAKRADIIVAATPSDWRASRNNRALVRRVLRAATTAMQQERVS
jgi:hypothetical protein